MSIAEAKISSMKVYVESISLSTDEKSLSAWIYTDDKKFSPFEGGVKVDFTFKGRITRVSVFCPQSYLRFTADLKYLQEETREAIQSLVNAAMNTPQFEGYLEHTGRKKVGAK